MKMKFLNLIPDISEDKMSLQQSYLEDLKNLEQITMLMYTHQSNFNQTLDINCTQQLEQVLICITDRLKIQLQNIQQQQSEHLSVRNRLDSILKNITEKRVSNIFESAIPKYMKINRDEVIKLYPGFRFIRKILKPSIYSVYTDGAPQYTNYSVVSAMGNKRVQVSRVNFDGQSIGSLEIVTLKEISRNRHTWQFADTSRLIIGIASDEGIPIRSSKDPFMNYKLAVHMHNNIVIPEVGLLAEVDLKSYVVISVNPPVLKYIGNREKVHKITARTEETNWKVCQADNSDYKYLIERTIYFGVMGNDI